MSQDRTQTWVEGYIRAWKTNDEADIRSLFTDDAEYRTSPFAEPWKGTDQILRGWLARRDIGDDWDFNFEVLAATSKLGIVRGWTSYRNPPRAYSNIWVIAFGDGGRAASFTEWFMQADPEHKD